LQHTGEAAVNYVILLCVIIPSCYSLFEATLSQLKIFMNLETMRKQQRMMLEIFEKQKESVLVIQTPDFTA